MESSLFLRHGPLPPLRLRIPSPATVTILSSLPLTNTKTSILHRPLGHGFGPVCAINGFPKASTNDDGKQIVRESVGASLALACVLGIISCGCTMSPPVAIAVNRAQKTISMPGFSHIYPLDGRVALKSLLDTSVYLASKQRKPKNPVLPSWESKDKPTPKQVAASFKEMAMWLMKSGKSEDAVKLLKKACKDCWDSETRFNLELALVEVLICLGKYPEALKCDCFRSSGGPSDGRLLLYQAIIYTMLGDRKEDAKKCWREYARSVEGIEDFPNPEDWP
ncbi:uncharacterized protein LOC132172461 [Corylus avellana]|uniref:uncharacterized protein LOC132172461 n=1 Tax=Corylus avellana TaxID=13451 RepID=UPI00286C2B86|nr:uncharacterized protein LOC132172461 [Corylus avellana]